MRLVLFLLATAPVGAAHATSSPPPAHTVVLRSINRHETFRLRPDPGGRFGKKELRGFNHFLRCHHSGREHAMAPRLAELLYATSSHFDFRPLFVVAGYRAPKIARDKGNPKSPHKQGVACDFRVEGVANAALRDYLRTLKRVGVGYYPNSDFVHLDVARKASYFWIDYSGPGEQARYSPSPETDLMKEGSGGEEPQPPRQPGVVNPQTQALIPPNP